VIDISIVIATFNGGEYLEELYKELKEALDKISRSYEIIIVNDASTDSSLQVMDRLAARDARMKSISLGRKQGQYAALSIGINHSVGNIVITMDDDMQNKPSDLPLMLGALNNGNDIACGWRKARKEPFLSRIVPSYLFNLLVSILIGKRLHDLGCSFKAFRREVVEQMKSGDKITYFIPRLADYKLEEVRVGTVFQAKTRYPSLRLAENAFMIIGVCAQYRLARFKRILCSLITARSSSVKRLRCKK